MIWRLPEEAVVGANPEWKVYIFKKADSPPSNSDIATHLAGNWGTYGHTNQQLKDKGLMVYRTIPQRTTQMWDFRVLSGVTYHYRIVVAERTETNGKLLSSSVDVSIQATTSVIINVVSGKELVIRSLEKVIDGVASAKTGAKPILDKNVKVHADFSRDKSEDVWFTVTRGAGQNAQRFLDSFIAKYADSYVQGEIDIDVCLVDWVTVGNPALRDKITDVMRATRGLLRHYILKVGGASVQDAKIVMAGDSEGNMNDVGEVGVRGSMNVIMTIENKLQYGAPAPEGISLISSYGFTP